MLEKNDKIIRNRLFRGTDSLFSDPLDYEKSLEDYELKGKNILLLVYDIKETDYIQVNIALKGQKIVKNCDKYMRIKELEGMLVKEIGVFHVLCSLESGLKIEESNTLAMIENGDKILNFVGVEFEEYYRVFNYANEIKKELIINENKNLIDLPD